MGIAHHGRTYRLDWEDPTIREWDCIVAWSDPTDPEAGIVLDRSAFYPGEPALQAAEATRFARAVKAAGGHVEVETSGTVPLGDLADAIGLVVASPKLSSAGMRPEARLRWHVLRGLAALPHVVFKFVVAGPVELAEADAVVKRLSLPPSKVWVMPEATERDALLERMACLAGPVAERGWSLSGRLQVLLWGDERGR